MLRHAGLPALLYMSSCCSAVCAALEEMIQDDDLVLYAAADRLSQAEEQISLRSDCDPARKGQERRRGAVLQEGNSASCFRLVL